MLVACSAATRDDPGATPTATETHEVPATSDISLRVVGIVDAGTWPDGTSRRAARVEVRNGLAVPILYMGPLGDDGHMLLAFPDVSYRARRADGWYESVETPGSWDATNWVRLTVEPGATAQLRVLLEPSMLAGRDADLPWRLCIRGDVAEWLVTGRCTPPFLPRDGSAVKLPPEPPPWVEYVDVDDRWSGLSGPEGMRVIVSPSHPLPDEIVITGERILRQGGGAKQDSHPPAGYEAETMRKGWSNGRGGEYSRTDAESMPQAMVDRLAALVRAPSVSRDTYLDQIVEPTWLAANAAAAFATLPNRSPPCRPEAEALFAGRFADPAYVRAALVARHESRHTDDYPRVSIRVIFSDGTTRSIGSMRQHDRLLPWTTGAGESWDPAIAEAIEAVLPDDTPNHDRLRGRGRLELLAEAVQEHIPSTEWFAACE
jgi:hypothetical protein